MTSCYKKTKYQIALRYEVTATEQKRYLEQSLNVETNRRWAEHWLEYTLRSQLQLR